jgi:hypothetical protein
MHKPCCAPRLPLDPRRVASPETACDTVGRAHPDGRGAADQVLIQGGAFAMGDHFDEGHSGAERRLCTALNSTISIWIRPS